MESSESQRARRVRFSHPVRVTTVDGEPRAWRTLSANLSKHGLFVRMPQPLEPGTRVAISLEAHGRALPFAQGEVRWCRVQPSELEGRFQGCGVRFTGFLHPRSPELVDYLVKTLETGAPLTLAPRRRRRERVLALVAASALVGLAAAAVLVFGLPTAGPEEAPVPGPGALEVLSVAPKTADELAALIAPAEEPSADDLAVAEEDAAPDADAFERAPAAPASGGPAESEVVEQPVAAEPERSAATPVGADDAPVVGAPSRSSTSGADAPVGLEPSPIGGPERAREAPGAPAERLAPSGGPAPSPPEDGAAPPGGAVTLARVPVPTPGRAIEPTPPGREGTSAATPELAAAHTTTAAPAAPSGSRPSSHAPKSPGPAGHVALPSGAASGVSWSPTPDGLDVRPELRPEARVARVFALSDPPRLVFDIEGSAPAKSHATALKSGLLSRVRLGRQGSRTRVVLDLGVEPQRVVTHGDRATVRF